MPPLKSVIISLIALCLLPACSMVINEVLIPEKAKDVHIFPSNMQGVYKVLHNKEEQFINKKDKFGGDSYVVFEIKNKRNLVVTVLHLLTQKEWDNDTILVQNRGFRKTDSCLMKNAYKKGQICIPYKKIKDNYIITEPEFLIIDALHNAYHEYSQDSLRFVQRVYIRKKNNRLFFNSLNEKRGQVTDSTSHRKGYETLILEEDSGALFLRVNIAKKSKMGRSSTSFLGIRINTPNNYLIHPTDLQLDTILKTEDLYPKALKLVKIENEEDFGYHLTNKHKKENTILSQTPSYTYIYYSIGFVGICFFALVLYYRRK